MLWKKSESPGPLTLSHTLDVCTSTYLVIVALAERSDLLVLRTPVFFEIVLLS